MTSPLQRLETAAYMPCKVRLHTQTDGNIRFRHSIAVLAYCGKGHPDDSVIFGDFRDQIDVKGRGSVIEDHDDFIAVSGFAYGAHSMAFMAAREETK